MSIPLLHSRKNCKKYLGIAGPAGSLFQNDGIRRLKNLANPDVRVLQLVGDFPYVFDVTF
jgi:hypothetical protein